MQYPTIRILMLEDSPLDADLCTAKLRRAGLDFEAARVDTRGGFETTIRRQQFDLILADYALPDFDGLSALAIAREYCPDVPFIIVSGVLGEEFAIEALQRGATDYVLKPRLDRLGPAVERALAESRKEQSRKRAEAELHKWQEFARRVLESTRDVIMTISCDGRVLSVNSCGLQAMALADPATGADSLWLDLWSNVDRHAAWEALEYAAGGGAQSFEASTRRPDGALCYWDVLVTPVRDASGRVEQLLSVARDVTDRHHAEHERQELLARERQARADAENKAIRLQQSIEDLEHFASIASHDLKEPLRTVTMYCQMLSRHCSDGLSADARNYLSWVEQGTRRMAALLHDLLSYSRVVHDDDPDSVVDMNAVVEEAVRNCSVAIEESGAEVHVGPMPMVRAHRPQLLQVFQNLIENAVKYRGGGRKPRVDVTARRLGDVWQFGVQDNGIGFNPQYADRIFGIFKRLHGSEYPGTGIGLAICRRVIERHHGRIWAESNPGEGALFSFTLPVAEPGASGAPPSPTASGLDSVPLQ